jgi:hypothetical protein
MFKAGIWRLISEIVTAWMTGDRGLATSMDGGKILPPAASQAGLCTM